MQITPYEDLKITTMTLIMTLSGVVDTTAAFNLLPITRIIVQQTRESAKCKLPHCKIPGAILSMRTRTSVRGIIKNTVPPFKNSITLDISTTKKNISLKLSPETIQMCGASSLEDGIEAANHIVSHLDKIQYILDKMHQNINSTLEAIKWIKQVTRGEQLIREHVEEKSTPTLCMRIISHTQDFGIIRCALSVPEDFDAEIVDFLFSFCYDFMYHSDMCKKLDFITNIKRVYSKQVQVTSVDEVMVNYNFNLGFQVDRVALNSLMDGRNGFVSRYNNALSTPVTIELPYEIDEPEENKEGPTKRKKNKVPKMSFLCYRSSSITYSGRGVENMRDPYYLFMQTLSELRPFIEYKE